MSTLRKTIYAVKDCKNGKERIIPISDSLSSVCQEYLRYRDQTSFRGNKIRILFCQTWWSKCGQGVGSWFKKWSGIKQLYLMLDEGNGPRISWSETYFCSYLARYYGRVRNWSLCFLCQYSPTNLGHQSLGATNHYVRLTANMYPDLIKDLDIVCFRCISKFKNYEADWFFKYISDFISRYLPNEKGASSNTIAAYRDTFVCFWISTQNEKHIRIEKLTLEKITKELSSSFSIDSKRLENVATQRRNIRLAAIHSFL